jgi:hypothetical protein
LVRVFRIVLAPEEPRAYPEDQRSVPLDNGPKCTLIGRPHEAVEELSIRALILSHYFPRGPVNRLGHVVASLPHCSPHYFAHEGVLFDDF